MTAGATGSRRPAVFLVALVAAWAPALCRGADTLFVDVSPAWGLGLHIPAEGHGTGVAAADFDGDGLVDLFVPQAAGTPDRLYQNLGDEFVEIAGSVGLDSLASSRVGLWLDFDGDADLDLWVANDDIDAPSSFTLYRQDPGPTFVDVTIAAGVAKPPIVEQPTHHWAGICAGDINGDEYLDVYTAQWPGPGHLFLNTGAGGFVDISSSSGIDLSRNAHQCAMEDFDGDGLTDIYVAIDFEANLLWLNQGDNTFVESAASAGLDNAMNDMGLTLGDFDGDDDFDAYVTNIFNSDPPPDGPRHNVLLRNDSQAGGLDFEEVAGPMGVDQGFFGWGATFADFDNDGDLDLAATNGWRSGVFTDDPSRFFENPGNGQPFLERSTEVDFDDTDWGSALLAADFDRDGDLDMIQACMPMEISAPVRLLDNQRPLGTGNYLVIRPRSSGPNHFAVGAKVRVGIGQTVMLRRISAGTSYMSQEPHEAFFGVGAATAVDWVRVDWPDGSTTTLYDVEANQELTVELLFSDGFESGDTSRWDQTVQ